MRNNLYKINIDTGGTFTDCLAEDRQGRKYRLKVLSNSTLRGNITEWIDNRQFKINENWNLPKDILFGFQFRLLKHKHDKIHVESYNIQDKTLTLSALLPKEFSGTPAGFDITSGEEAPVLAARIVTGTPLNSEFPPIDMQLGSTKGTNALLEKKGAKTVLFVTKGFKDILHIGNQQRPDIFALNVVKPEPLPEKIIEVDERIDASGKVLSTLSENKLQELDLLNRRGYTCTAISLLNACKNPLHELKLSNYLQRAGFNDISVSTELSPQIKYLQRTETTTVNAYLSPVINGYLNSIRSGLKGSNLRLMTSAGGLVDADSFYPKDSLLSGPAGGVVGAGAIGKQSGFNKLITFDMGGTSTDVSRIDGTYEYTFDLKVGAAEIFSPAISIETVAAGGGSICYFDGFKLCVGPQSAGAIPGPACYGAGGPLTITDVNLLAGRLDIQQFGIPVFKDEAQKRLDTLINQIKTETGKTSKKEMILLGFLQIANEIMAAAIKKISVSKGYDPVDYALIAFGGAGGIHACDIAEQLKINKIVIPADAGILSAVGISHAAIERFAEKQILMPFWENEDCIAQWLNELDIKAIGSVLAEKVAKDDIEIRQRLIYLRLKGQDSHIEVEWQNTVHKTIRIFENRYEQIYGYRAAYQEIEIESIRVIAAVKKPKRAIEGGVNEKYRPRESHYIRCLVGQDWLDVPVFYNTNLKAGATITGPALLLGQHNTSFVSREWEMQLDANGNCILRFVLQNRRRTNISRLRKEESAESELELFTNRFMFIAENMGAMLQRTSRSVNVKERLDFSCALLDKEGFLIANAPHIPVHLGSLGTCVRSLINTVPMKKGDVIITNHPAHGGSHLPDVTLVSPVYSDSDNHMGFVVNRVHHAEMGGKVPASMPPDATSLIEEGVIIFPFKLVNNHKVDWQGMKNILTRAAYPTRSLDENIADIHASLAANRNGAAALLQLIRDFGEDKVTDQMKRLKNHAKNKTRQILKDIPDGQYKAEEYLDDGTPLKVEITVNGESCKFDFTGSGPVHSGNMNATPAIVHSVVIYFLRLLINEPLPLNDGMFEPVTLVLPKGLLNPDFPSNPAECPAIVGGNTEISQRLTDTLLKAFKVMACSQGTMNNVMFGTDSFSYYETVCGGCGAGKDFNGASGVHHHMTNTRITDPEIFEHRYPVRLERFELRKDSGGKGQFNGGNGTIREITFLEPVSLSVLSQHRREAPYGLNGGSAGKKGRQYIVRANGSLNHLKGIDGVELGNGDKLVIETPGGGGYGEKQ